MNKDRILKEVKTARSLLIQGDIFRPLEILKELRIQLEEDLK